MVTRMNDDDMDDDLSVRESPLGLVGEHANTDDKDPEASRRRYVLSRARACLERAALERAEQELAASKEEEVFDLAAYLRQFPQPLYPRR